MTARTQEPMPGMGEYRANIDDLRFSDEAKARMAARLAQAAQTQDKEHPMSTKPVASTRRKRRLPLAAAAACLAVALGIGGAAYASGALVSVQRFVSHLFGASEAQVEVVDKVGRPVGVSASSNGVTVTADAIIGDKTNVAVIFSIAKDDGSAFEGIEPLDNGLYPLGFAEADVDVDLGLNALAAGLANASWGVSGSSYFYDADPSDNAIQLVETRSFSSDAEGGISLVGRTMTAHFSKLTHYTEDGTEPILLADGNWKLTFPLTYEDASVQLPAGQDFDLNGIDATIDELVISPIAVRMAYTADTKAEWADAPSGKEPEEDSTLAYTLLSPSITINMTDGTTVAVDTNGGGSIGNNGDVTNCETNVFFDRILNLDEVASVTIGGTTIEL